MIPKIPKLSNIFEHVDTQLNAKFVFDDKEYDITQFHINFKQGVDYKGQPQHETQGGQLSFTLSENIGNNIYDWAKRSGKRKDGKVQFRNQTEGTVLHIVFVNAYCIHLGRVVDSFSGTKTTLVVAAEKITMNGYTYDNKWRD